MESCQPIKRVKDKKKKKKKKKNVIFGQLQKYHLYTLLFTFNVDAFKLGTKTMEFAQLNLIHSYEMLPSVLINNCVLCWHLLIRRNTVTYKS